MASKKVDLHNPIFHDDDAAREHLEAILWPHGAVCPRCGSMGERITKLQGKSTRPGVYKCKDCRKPFSVTVGTVMERSHIPLSKWLLAAQFMASSKKSMSALQLHRMLGTSYEAVWFLFHRLREATNDIDGSGPLGGEDKFVEADEAYIGGKARNKAHVPPPKKMAVFTLIERGGEARSKHVAEVTAETIRPLIVTTASRKSDLRTDESGVYWKVGEEFKSHTTVVHSTDEYVRETLTRIRSNCSSPCSSERFTANFITSARLTYNVTFSRPISNTTTAQRSAMTMWIALSLYCAAQRVNGFCIDSLAKPRTPKQKTRTFLRWRTKRKQ